MCRGPEPDAILQQIADYVFDLDRITGDNAMDTARLCLMDTLGCGLLALNYPACVKMLGPIVPGATMQGGARVPGTSYELDPVQAAFNIGAMVRWLDFNDTWLVSGNAGGDFEWAVVSPMSDGSTVQPFSVSC